MKVVLIVAGIIHALFMIAELFPWGIPALLGIVTKSLPDDQAFQPKQQKLVATIVHNAGIYNGILAGGMFWAAAVGGPPATELARVMFCGALAAGVFGAVTLKSVVPAVQAAAGLAGLFFL